MSITVVCHLHIQPEHQAEVIQIVSSQLSQPAHAAQARRFARLFQHADDPSHLLYVAEWSSRDAFEAHRRQQPLPGRPDQHVRPPACRYFQRLASFERVLAPIRDVSAIIVGGPDATHARRRDLAVAYHRTSPHARTGVGTFVIHEAIDEPVGLLILSGWETWPDASSSPTPDQELSGQLRDAGGIADVFRGHAVAETRDR